MSDTKMNITHDKKIEEFDIQVPWGRIAVKTWGSNNDPHIIMVHGYGDNAGAFDRLIPHLPNIFYYISFDLPGHGMSSHFPPHLPIHATDFLIPLKIVIKHFNKQKYIYIGHSLGSVVGSLFTQLYPHYIEKIISIDGTPSFFPFEADSYIKSLQELIDMNMVILEKLKTGKAPSYSYENILEKFRTNRFEGEILSREAAIPILNRSLKFTGDGKYCLTTDQRIKAVINPLQDSEFQIKTLKHNPITCPALFIFAKENHLPLQKTKSVMTHFFKIKNLTVVNVDGKHDVHNNNPELVAEHINNFLLTQMSKV